MTETWKIIAETFDCYSVSSHGRIRRNDSGKILKMRNTRDGYLLVNLSCHGLQFTKQVHRLVAEAFLGMPCDNSVVNHKDEDKENNHVDNLEWCTVEYNNNYGTRKGNFKVKVAMCDMENNVISVFCSMFEAFNKTGVNFGSISNVIKGKSQTAGGYKWIKI